MSTNFKKIHSIKFLAFVLAITSVFTSCLKEQIETEQVSNEPKTDQMLLDRNATPNVVEIALSNPDFSILVAAVVKTESVNFFSSPSLNATVFAPTNAAFQALPAPFNSAAGISGISDAKTINTLRQILRYHASAGKKTAAQLPNGSYSTFKNGAHPNGNKIFIGRSIGNEVYVNGYSKVVAADIQASNGIIHVIDKVLLPPSQTVADIAASNPAFTALSAAIKKAGFTNLLNLPVGSYTAFAPTDAAFAALPAPLNTAENIKNITDPATINTLKNVLRYHLLGGYVFSADLREGIQPSTLLSNKKVTISLSSGATVKGDGNASASNIVITNVLGTNGVIHAIDQVLLP